MSAENAMGRSSLVLRMLCRFVATRRGIGLHALLPFLGLFIGISPCRAQEAGFSWQPPQASASAGRIDALFDFLLLMSALIAGSVCLLIVIFCFKYRRGNKADRSKPPAENLPLELTWTGIPIVLAIITFIWGARLYYDLFRPPKNALTIYVVGKQWMWKIQHPAGRREINELHVPVGRPVKLVMTSQDVIHDFAIPAFRTKQDVLPGRYTEQWFTAIRPGRYQIYCAQYCGTDHSKMTGWVYAVSPEKYAEWLQQGNPQTTMAAQGERLFTQYGCSGCHGPASTVHAPSLVGIYNNLVPLADRSFVRADDRYLNDSIVMPSAQIAAGYRDVMPAYKNVLAEDQILQIITYIRSLGTTPVDRFLPTDSGSGQETERSRAVIQASGSAGHGVESGAFQALRQNAIERSRSMEERRRE